ncbi:MAG: hypothetical protein PHR19_08270 [Bacteroidales bacterium]|nr:hypothetical protein [Bacteroidales bacterium]
MIGKNEIQEWVNAVKVDLISQYNSSGRRASGRWEKELEEQIEVTPAKIRIKILGAAYTRWMETGRGPTKSPGSGGPKLFDLIKIWIQDKGITSDLPLNSLAYLITRKIHREGYKGKPLATPIVTQKRVDEIVSRIVDASSIDMRSDIIEQFKK